MHGPDRDEIVTSGFSAGLTVTVTFEKPASSVFDASFNRYEIQLRS